MEHEESSSTSGGDEFRFIQPADRLETLFSMLSRLGLQSNLLVAATYSSSNSESDGGVLTRTQTMRALRAVIKKHSQLYLTYASRPSETKKGNHRCWTAQLNQLDLDDCVEFVQDNSVGEKGLTRQIIERAHGIYFNHGKERGPLWKLIVVNGKHAMFVYDHFMGDGRSGLAVHRSMLEALNSTASSAASESPDGGEAPLDVPTLEPRDPIDNQIELQGSIFHIICHVLLLYFIRFFFRRKDMFFNDATYGALDLTYNPDQPRKEVITAVEILRLDAPTVSKCIDACRQHNTTITALIHTLIKISLAADVYPEAQVCISNLPLDLRKYAAEDDGLHGHGTVMNAAASFSNKTWLAEFRKAGTSPQPLRPVDPPPRDDPIKLPPPPPPPQHHIDRARVWSLARAYKDTLAEHMKHGKQIFGARKAIEWIGSDEEDCITQMIASYGLSHKQSFLLSNIGSFDPNPIPPTTTTTTTTPVSSTSSPSSSPYWTISDLEFSVSAVKAGIGPELSFGMVSVKAGDCVIHANYEKGVLEPEMVQELLRGVRARLEVLLDCS